MEIGDIIKDNLGEYEVLNISKLNTPTTIGYEYKGIDVIGSKTTRLLTLIKECNLLGRKHK